MPPFFWSLVESLEKIIIKLLKSKKNSFQGVFLLYFINLCILPG